MAGKPDPSRQTGTRPSPVRAEATRREPVKAEGTRADAVRASATRQTPTRAMTFGLDTGAIPPDYNVLLVVLDDVGVHWLEFMGIGEKYATGLAFTDDQFSYAYTPFMSSIAESTGVWFSEYYATSICSSSRARVHTGRRSDYTGVGANVRAPQTAVDSDTWPATGISIDASKLFLAEYLRNVRPSISTAHFGKWHLCDPWSTVGDGGSTHTPDTNLTDPSKFGFQTSVWSPLPYGGQYQWWKIDNGTPTYVDGVTTATYDETTYPSAVMCAAASTWLAARTGQFFCSVSIDPPHMPLTSPPFTLLSAATAAELTSLGYLPGDNLTGNPQNQTPRNNPEFYPAYKANIEVADTLLRRLWYSIPSNLRAKTYLIVLSDNGGAAASIPEGFPTDGKGTLTKQGLQGPMLIMGPGVARPGREVKNLVDIGDVAATTAELMDAVTEVFKPSTSMVPILLDAVDREDPMAIKTSSIEQIFYPLGETTPSAFTPSTRFRSIYDGRYRLILGPAGTDPQFFDNESDPLEATDIYGDLNATQQAAYTSLYTALLANLPV